MQLNKIVNFLDNLLPGAQYKDSAINGLQVESANSDIKRVALAVDSGLSVIEQAIDAQAQLLIVHHGLFWGKEQPITGPYAKKVNLLMQAGCSLYASHLPLDANQSFGNNFEMARYFGLDNIKAGFNYHAQAIGAIAAIRQPKTLNYFTDKAHKMLGAKEPLILAFGRPKIKTVGLVTGGGSFGVAEAAKLGLDLFISGEPKYEVYHLAKELRLNCLFVGHYASETFGVRAIGKLLKRKFKLDNIFVNEATGI